MYQKDCKKEGSYHEAKSLFGYGDLLCQWEINWIFENPKPQIGTMYANINTTVLVCAFWASMMPFILLLGII